MLTVKSNPLELRGIAHKSSKKDTIYYVINCETDDGTSYGFYCPNVAALPQGLKKGDMVIVTFDVTYYKNNERLIVSCVEKVEA